MKTETIEEAIERMRKDMYGVFISKDADVKGQLVIDTANAAFSSGVKEGIKFAQKSLFKEYLRNAYFSAIKSTGEGWNGEYADGNSPNVDEKFEEGFNEWFENFKKNEK
jgi:hypothetical protein